MKTNFLLLFGLLLGIHTHAADRVWSGNAGNDLWSNPNNWSPVGVPQNGEELRFPRIGAFGVPITMVNDLVGLRPGTMIFGGTSGAVSYTLNGNTLHLATWVLIGAVDSDTETANVTINCPLVLEADTRFQVAYVLRTFFSSYFSPK